jgi:hypothetical protein
MHWFDLPKVTHNEDEIRAYEQEESKRISKRLKKLAWGIAPIILFILWLWKC